MSTFSSIHADWQQTLKALYPEREVSNLFRFAVEDLFGFTLAEQTVRKDAVQPETIHSRLTEVRDRLLTGEPLQYIVGFTYFDELKLVVSPAVLIPRPETEELVHWILGSVPAGFNGTITDWCTGSGCIALALKYHLPEAQISGYDLSEEALEVARLNGKRLELDVRLETRDALSPGTAEEADVIVSNPPYIPENELAVMRKNVKEFEPHMALFVPDNQALLFYEAITEKALHQLQPDGQLFFELHEDFAGATKAMIEATGAFHSVEIRHDLQGKARMLRAVRK